MNNMKVPIIARLVNIEDMEEEIRKGVKRKPMTLSEAHALLKEAYEDYNHALGMARCTLKKNTNSIQKWEREANSVKIRVENIFLSCSELYNYVQEDFFNANYFESDFKELMNKLDQMSNE